MDPELDNTYSWWKVGSVPVLLTEYRKSKVCQSLMYMQHRHMVCGEFHICHDLDLDQTVNFSAYPTPLLHEALDLNHKMVMLGTGWYHNTFSHMCAASALSWTWYSLLIHFLLLDIFLYIPWSMTPRLRIILRHMFLELLGRLTSSFGVHECIRICESNVLDPGNWTWDINLYI